MLFQAPPPPTAFVDVAVLTMEQSGVTEHQTVLVKDGRVFWVGPTKQAPALKSYRVIDGRGQFLLPGFSDMHTHPGRPLDLVTYLANGITTIRVMWGDTGTLGWRNAVLAGTLAGPRIVTSGAIIDGSPPSQPSMTVLTDPAKARAEVTAQHRAGFDFIKVYNSVPKAVYDTIVRVARGFGMPVAGHVPFEVGLTGALAAKQASIEHLRGYIAELVPKDAAVQPGATLRSRTVAWNYIDRSRFPGLVEQTARAGVWNTPTFVVAYHMMLPDSAYRALVERPEVKLFPGQGTPDRSKISYLADFTEADYVEAQRALVPQLALARALANGGARLMIGTDSWLQGYAYHDELLLFERAGFSPAEVLRLATRAGPEFLGNALTQGTVAPGQVADLQLVGGNPLQSLGNLKDRRGVMARGRWYSAADLQARLTPGAPRPEDVGTLDGIINAYYDVVSGPAGSVPDQARDQTLHHPNARITLLNRKADGTTSADMITLAEYYQRSGTGPRKVGFFEREIHRTTERIGSLVHVWSTYESSDQPVGGKTHWGINSIQLYWDGVRWWVLGWVFDDDRHGLPIPARYLPTARGSVPASGAR